MTSESKGMWCIYYRKIEEPTTWKVLKVERSDGVLVSAKKRNEAYTFIRFRDALSYARKLIETNKYMAEVKKLSGLCFAE